MVLARYNRAVQVSMTASSACGIPDESSDSPKHSVRFNVTVRPNDRRADAPPAFTTADRRRRTLARIFAVAGAASALVSATLVIATQALKHDHVWSIKQVVLVWLLLSWPVLPTAAYVSGLRQTAAIVVTIAVISAVCIIEPGLFATSLYFALPPILVAWPLSMRTVRAVSPFVFAGVFALVVVLYFGLQGAIFISGPSGDSLPIVLPIVLAIMSAAGALIGYAGLRRRSAKYRHKETSDLMLAVNSSWFVNTLWVCLMLSMDWSVAGVAGLVSYAAYLIALGCQLRGLREQGRRPPSLLLLRV